MRDAPEKSPHNRQDRNPPLDGRMVRAPGQLGHPGLTLADLPSPNTKRWVIRRKAEVVAGVRHGVISLEEACRRYKLSIEEFLSWQRLIESHGMAGLRATRLQDYRPAAKLE
jgi:hypothetical protein